MAEEPEFQGQDLSACLIVPVQRLPRYVLLLQDLLKATPEYHVEHKNIIIAIEKLRQSTDAVNTKAREVEQLNRVYEIQSKLIGENVPNLVRPHRRLIRNGELISISETPQLYTVMLFNDLILIGIKEAPSGYTLSTLIYYPDKIRVVRALSLFNAHAQLLPDQPPSSFAFPSFFSSPPFPPFALLISPPLLIVPSFLFSSCLTHLFLLSRFPWTPFCPTSFPPLPRFYHSSL